VGLGVSCSSSDKKENRKISGIPVRAISLIVRCFPESITGKPEAKPGVRGPFVFERLSGFCINREPEFTYQPICP
jgi:hypothetical protein